MFILCRTSSSKPIIKLSIHPSFTKLKSSPYLNVRRFVGTLSAGSSRSGSREALDQIHKDKESKSEELLTPQQQSGQAEQKEEREFTEGKCETDEKLSGGHEGAARELKEKDGDVKVHETDSHTADETSEVVDSDGVSSKESVDDQEVMIEGTADQVERQREEDKGCDERDQQKRERESNVANGNTETPPPTADNNTFDSAHEYEMVSKQSEREEKPILESRQESSQPGSVSLESTVDSFASTSESVEPAKAPLEESENKDLESEKESSSVPEHSRGKSIIPTAALAHGISHVKADLKEIKGALKLGKLTEFISQATSHSPILQRKSEQTSYSVGGEVVRLSSETPLDVCATPSVTSAPVDPEEEQRRVLMAKMVEQDEDIVVATKSQSRTKKTRKRKTRKTSKLSSATSKLLSLS